MGKGWGDDKDKEPLPGGCNFLLVFLFWLLR